MKKAILFTLCISIIISLFSLTAFADSDIAEFTELPAGFELTIAEPRSGDSYQLWVGKVGVTEDELAEISNEDDFMSRVGYVDFAMAKNTDSISFTVDLSTVTDYGYYNARVIRSGTDGIEDGYYTYKHVDPTLSQRAMEEFMAVSTDEDFAAKLAEFSVAPNDFFSFDDLGLLQDEDIAESVGGNFALIRDYKYLEGGELETVSDIIDCAEAAYALSALLGEDVDEASDRIEKYVSFVPELFPARKDTETAMKLISASKECIADGESLGVILSTAKEYAGTIDEKSFVLFDKFKTEISSADELETVIRWSDTLSKLKDATRAEIEKIITDNSTLLGVDVSAEAHYGISLTKVAHRFDGAKAETLYGIAAFGEYYDSVAKAIYDEEATKKVQQQPGKNYGSGGGGGGSFGGKTAYVKPTEATTPEKTEEVTEQKASALPFTDIFDYAWALEDIRILYDKGVVSGVDVDSFEPNRPVTRAEFVKMMVVSFNISGNNEVVFAFDDVSRDMWSYPYIEAAYRSGIVSGMSKKYFGASETITRQDAAVMIARVLGLNAVSGQSEFHDAGDVADYAKGAVAAVSESGIMNGMANGSFEPMGVTTRAQAAAIISRAMQGGASR